jgi:hypothetical protein
MFVPFAQSLGNLARRVSPEPASGMLNLADDIVEPGEEGSFVVDAVVQVLSRVRKDLAVLDVKLSRLTYS